MKLPKPISVKEFGKATEQLDIDLSKQKDIESDLTKRIISIKALDNLEFDADFRRIQASPDSSERSAYVSRRYNEEVAKLKMEFQYGK